LGQESGEVKRAAYFLRFPEAIRAALAESPGVQCGGFGSDSAGSCEEEEEEDDGRGRFDGACAADSGKKAPPAAGAVPPPLDLAMRRAERRATRRMMRRAMCDGFETPMEKSIPAMGKAAQKASRRAMQEVMQAAMRQTTDGYGADWHCADVSCSEFEAFKVAMPRSGGVTEPQKGGDRVCRICLGEEADDAERREELPEELLLEEDLRFVAPCVCRGSSKYVHLSCLRMFFEARGEWQDFSCQTCKQPYSGYALQYLAEVSRDRLAAVQGPHSPGVATALYHLSHAHSQLGNVRLSKRLLEQSLAMKEELYGLGHENTYAALTCLANLHGRLGNVRKKKTFLEEVLATRLHEQESGCSLGTTLNNLALCHGELGNNDMKCSLLQESLKIKRELPSLADDPRLAATLSNLAVAYGERGDAVAKRSLLVQALAINEQHFGEGHIRTATTLHNLALAHGELDARETSKALLEKSLAIQEAHFGADHGDMALTLACLGVACGTLAQHESAASSVGRALRILQGDLAPSAQVCGLTMLRAATVEHARGRLGRAEELQLRGSMKMREALGQAARHRITTKCERMARIWRVAGFGDTADWVASTLARMQALAPHNSPRGRQQPRKCGGSPRGARRPPRPPADELRVDESAQAWSCEGRAGIMAFMDGRPGG